MSTNPETLVLRIVVMPYLGGAILRWEADVLGARSSRFAAPFSTADIGLVQRALDAIQDPAYPTVRSADQRRRFSFGEDERTRLSELGLWDEAGRVRADTPRRVGSRIYQALVADPIAAQALGTARDHAAALGHALAVELCLPPGAVELAALPWELLWDDGPLPLFLGRNVGSSLVRRLDLPAALPDRPANQGPLRILAISPEAGIAPEIRQAEREARLAAWQPLITAGRAEIEELEPANRAGLLRAMQSGRPPDIVHYYGHGRYQHGTGSLLLDGADGWTPAVALAAALNEAGMVVLQACQGATLGEAGGTEEPLLSGVAQALCAAGVPIVLAMQHSIRTDAAARMANVIYTSLAGGRSIQDAVSLARRVLFVEEAARVSWFVPALYLRERSNGPLYLRRSDPPAPLAAPVVGQHVVARDGGSISALRLRGSTMSHQQVLAERGGQISDVVITSG